ncbi:Putative transcriptional regulatory protein CpxR [Wohlfahrtiimonas chitiniclastica SH04]|uniref:Putative transcriptional regulatory protein CpxR n=1 Tax=Wohlfahrtiimonas chitiniclastica SH04 TaxID=1261130 RepID=L8XYL5_9GAMM|nr:response regulator transcription factor [Wohlfahrtiimonas chitiniclastica]ELV07909.1 Putative transcriptional regulatory protein CpxR [Wohlfahrtiimonas chitiniclastica SH04]OYQ77850.1 DNA-binding response regulator [Wohlfahrtiimonas chitiniclastica]
MNNKKLLLVDDDIDFSELLSTYLSGEGLEVVVANDGFDALAIAQTSSFDVCLLDVMMPNLDGIETLKQLRQTYPNLPVIMLTAKSEPIDRILGLELGADDYISKPPEPRELLARIKAILRRAQQNSTQGVESFEKEKIHWDKQKRIFYINQQPIDLTGIEYEILVVLAENPGAVVPKDTISMQAMHKKLPPFNRSLDVHISNIRKKIIEHDVEIKSVRGRGYQLSV